MLKLRTKANKQYKIGKDVEFIEICDEDGALGALIHIKENGFIQIARPGDNLFENYLIRYNVPVTTFIKQSTKKS